MMTAHDKQTAGISGTPSAPSLHRCLPAARQHLNEALEMGRKNAARPNRLGALGLMVLGLSLGSPNDAVAQKQVWGDIDCSESRFVTMPGAKCRATNAFGSADQIAQFQAWAVRMNEPYRYLRVIESRNSVAHIRYAETGEEYLRWQSDRAKEATGFSDRMHRNGTDYYTFTAKNGEACTGFRRPGPARSVGYKWLMMGVLCLPKGTPLDQARIFEFMDSVQLK